ncbi:hypothetical protein AAHA92_06720 [Salvia divinorum]|uniref:Uncharacterized protein n=1 Tax=Salvia divinorum TaxID=28513 RepID=A0ABD1IA48_SALDI
MGCAGNISDEELTRNRKRYTMNENFSMVVEQVLFGCSQMILLDLLPPAKILIGGVLALGYSLKRFRRFDELLERRIDEKRSGYPQKLM